MAPFGYQVLQDNTTQLLSSPLPSLCSLSLLSSFLSSLSPFPSPSLAHTTQFTRPGLHYLGHGKGVGYLDGGGSYVTFFDNKTNDFTIVIESMVREPSSVAMS